MDPGEDQRSPTPVEPPPADDPTSPAPSAERPPPKTRISPRSLLLISVALCSMAALVCGLQRRSLRSAGSTYQARALALTRMQIDARRIGSLRDRPQRATDRQRPNDELLAQVEHALKGAGVPVQLWQDSIPQPAQRLPQSPYQRYGTRLYFEDVTIEQVVRFACALLAADPSLAVSSLHLVAPVQADLATWNADLTVSYLVYAPSGTG